MESNAQIEDRRIALEVLRQTGKTESANIGIREDPNSTSCGKKEREGIKDPQTDWETP